MIGVTLVPLPTTPDAMVDKYLSKQPNAPRSHAVCRLIPPTLKSRRLYR